MVKFEDQGDSCDAPSASDNIEKGVQAKLVDYSYYMCKELCFSPWPIVEQADRVQL